MTEIGFAIGGPPPATGKRARRQGSESEVSARHSEKIPFVHRQNFDPKGQVARPQSGHPRAWRTPVFAQGKAWALTASSAAIAQHIAMRRPATVVLPDLICRVRIPRHCLLFPPSLSTIPLPPCTLPSLERSAGAVGSLDNQPFYGQDKDNH